jgi:hypothetical protein
LGGAVCWADETGTVISKRIGIKIKDFDNIFMGHRLLKGDQPILRSRNRISLSTIKRFGYD